MQLLTKDMNWHLHVIATPLKQTQPASLSTLYSKHQDSFLPHTNDPMHLAQQQSFNHQCTPPLLATALKGPPLFSPESSFLSLACLPTLVSCELADVRGAELESILGAREAQDALKNMTAAAYLH
eukprot:GDKK01067028.1.p1 GENE.GDKK01067028.1~~GDKK01067028.1.p1  ORF type:complete len:125 (+),score=21.39 GDKK01067028.1:29-403(+)